MSQVKQLSTSKFLITLRELLRGVNYIVLFGVAVFVGFLFLLLITSKYSQRISLSNMTYVSLGDVVFALIIGLAIGTTVVVEIASISKVVKSTKTSGLSFFALIVAVVPSLVCCSPLLASIFGLLGVSSIMGLSATKFQYFAARYSVEIQLFAALIAVIAAIFALKNYANQCCQHCEVKSLEHQ
jgi:hypothetical protein